MAARAATITVTGETDVPIPGLCDLRQAIVAHNERTTPYPSGCTKGDGNDTIKLDAGGTYVSGSPLDPITNGSLTIEPADNNVCDSVINSAYITVKSGAKLTLHGVGIVVNGAEFKSVIDNDGGTLVIEPNGTSGPCTCSNQHGKERETTLGGVLNNRNNGTTTIKDANFVDSSASDRGGAILDDRGTVTIERGSFNGNNANFGGAIYVGKGATLNIKSSNFGLKNNRAGTAGGAIFSDGGIVNIQRDPAQPLGSVSISFNTAGGGGAIFAPGGQLNIDGMQFLGNSTSGDGGAIWLTKIVPASITRTYFHENSAKRKGASIYAGESTVNISGDTFARNTGGIYVEALGTLNVINSTFLGDSGALDGIHIISGSADVTFSTILLSSLSVLELSSFKLSNSILNVVTCANITDALHNQRNATSPDCPGVSSATTLGLASASLKGNGGATPTIALLSNSPAVGAIQLGNCLNFSNVPLTVDQRDAARPGPVNPGSCDTGAFEYGSPPGSNEVLPPNTPLN